MTYPTPAAAPASGKTFASDNYAGIHPEVLQALIDANTGHAIAYGGDPWTERAHRALRRHFGEDAQPALVFNGTAANVLALQALTRPFEAVLCSESAHIQEDECGAPERFTGCKLIGVPHRDGKITVEGLRTKMRGIGSQHQVQPRTISISQSTEFGTTYTPDEIRAISTYARAHDLYLHMDGARLANAAAYLGQSLREISRDCGVDALSFGGTKNGIMCGEAVIFFRPELARNFAFVRKQGMQLASKMRFISAQIAALLEGDLWLRNARHANEMAQNLAQQAGNIPGVSIPRPVQANGVFARVPVHAIAPLQAKFAFHVWDDRPVSLIPDPTSAATPPLPASTKAIHEVRWMTAFDTSAQDVDQLISHLRQIMHEEKPGTTR